MAYGEDIVTRLDDLIKQATTEKSHFYVADTARVAAAEIRRLRDLASKATQLRRALVGLVGVDTKWELEQMRENFFPPGELERFTNAIDALLETL